MHEGKQAVFTGSYSGRPMGGMLLTTALAPPNACSPSSLHQQHGAHTKLVLQRSGAETDRIGNSISNVGTHTHIRAKSVKCYLRHLTSVPYLWHLPEANLTGWIKLMQIPIFCSLHMLGELVGVAKRPGH